MIREELAAALPSKPDRFLAAVLEVVVVRMGSKFMATGSMAGVQFRGNAYPSQSEAMRDLFRQLSQETNADALLALELAASGEDASELRPGIAAALHTAGGGSTRQIEGGVDGVDQVAL